MQSVHAYRMLLYQDIVMNIQIITWHYNIEKINYLQCGGGSICVYLSDWLRIFFHLSVVRCIEKFIESRYIYVMALVSNYHIWPTAQCHVAVVDLVNIIMLDNIFKTSLNFLKHTYTQI